MPWNGNVGLVLLAFRAAVEMDPQGALRDWNPDDCNPCMWSGVHCVDGQVQMLWVLIILHVQDRVTYTCSW